MKSEMDLYANIEHNHFLNKYDFSREQMEHDAWMLHLFAMPAYVSTTSALFTINHLL